MSSSASSPTMGLMGAGSTLRVADNRLILPYFHDTAQGDIDMILESLGLIHRGSDVVEGGDADGDDGDFSAGAGFSLRGDEGGEDLFGAGDPGLGDGESLGM